MSKMPESELARREARFAAYQRRVMMPLLVVGFLFIATFVVQLTDPDVVSRWLFQITWIIFIVDYLVMLYLAPRKVRFISQHILYLIALILPPLRVYLLVGLAYRATISKHSPLRDRVGILAIYFTALIIIFGALLTWNFEKGHAGASIETYGEALWWAVVSITTVGYGDYVPVTVGGRIVATLVFFQGIAAVSVLTGVVVSYFSQDPETRAAVRRKKNENRRHRPEGEDRSQAAEAVPAEPVMDLAGIETRLAAIEALLQARHPAGGTADDRPGRTPPLD